MLATILLSLTTTGSNPRIDHVLLSSKKPVARAHQTQRDFSQGNTLYLIPYAHLDTQWRWSYPQVIREFIWNTMADNLALIDKYPNYVFNFSGSRRYEMMREYFPEEYAKVVAAVKAGRWFPCGSSVDENDANVPSAESTVRHVLYGNHWFRKNFGVASEEYMLPDCFGFPYALPTILNACGIKGFSTQKLTWGSSVGIPFKVGNWIGPDGTGVVAALDPGSYGSPVTEDLSQNTSWLARIQSNGKQSGAYVDYHYYGTGDRGGGPGDDSVAMAEVSVKGKGPIKVLSAAADEMFLSLTPEQKRRLPSYQGELLLTQHSAGSVTSQAYMKRFNRKSELLADAAERASVGAAIWAQKPYPQDRLYSAWDLVLGTQMHDMLPGTSLPKAYEYCYNDYLLALNQFAHVQTDAIGAIANQLDTRAQGTPLVVQNALSIAREDVVEATVSMTGPVTVFDAAGQPVPTQILGRKDGKTHLLFLAKVPANSFSTFDARPVAAKQVVTVVAEGTKIESPRFRVTINANGDIASIYDKVNKRETLKSPARLDFQHHNPAEYPAWNMDWDDAKLPPSGQVKGPATLRIIENGPVRAAIEITRESMGSKFVQVVRIAAGGAGDRVEVQNHIDWSTREVALKAAFPLTTANPKATYDLQVGVTERGNNDSKKYEVPQHQWFDLTQPNRKYGVAILNDSKFGSDKPTDDTVRLTLLYTPGVRGGYQDQAVQDFGKHDILYAIAPHAGDWRQGKVAWTAKRLNQPLTAFATLPHAGRLGRATSLVSTNTDQVEIMAVKRAEDGDGYVVRLRELTGKPANVRVAFPGAFSADLVDGQERFLSKAKVENGAVNASVRGFGLSTYRVRLIQTRIALPQPISKPITLGYNLDVASSDKNRKDGAFDKAGRSYSADLLPKQLTSDGVNFRLGSTRDRAKNALAAKGQSIPVPAGSARVYVLAAATEDAKATFRVGNAATSVTVPSWTGYVGQWDTRLWAGVQPELAYDWHLPFAGVEPGYVKDAEVAWYGSHNHHPTTGNGYYEYTYLFKYGFDVPKGAKSITLPNDPRVRIFAVTAVTQPSDTATPAAPLYDTLEGRTASGGPKFVVPEATDGNGVSVSILHPVYWQGGRLVYTLDGSNPTARGAAYEGPIYVGKPTTIKAAQVDANGKIGPVAEVKVDVTDTVAPQVTEATIVRSLGFATLKFSEPIDRGIGSNPVSYRAAGLNVTSATVNTAGDGVVLTFAGPVSPGAGETLTVGINDRVGNALSDPKVKLTESAPVFTAPELAPSKSQSFASNAPANGTDAWTINLWVRVEKMPEPRTMIGGFGRARDGANGAGRYLTYFAKGINFWAANQDVSTSTPLDLGRWQMLTATYDGTTVRVYKDGKLIGEGESVLTNDSNRVNIMPRDAWENRLVLDGQVRDFTIWSAPLPVEAIGRLYQQGGK